MDNIKFGKLKEKALEYRQRAIKRQLERLKTSVPAPRRPVKVKRGKMGRVKQIPLKKLVKKADTLLSLFIRARDKRCALCGSTSNLTNGHLIKRGKKPVRWDESNCFCLCSTCNFRDKVDTNYHGKYVAWFIERYGVEKYKALEKLSEVKVPSIWIREKCLQVIEKYGKLQS